MRSECQFFMAAEDSMEFLTHAIDRHQLTLAGDGHVCTLSCSLGSIQFLRSQFADSLLTAGRIALATTGLDGECPSPDTAAGLEHIYRQLRRWLQKRYTNDLVAYSEASPMDRRKTIHYPMLWLGPRARHWLSVHPGAVLRQFLGGAVVFYPESLLHTAAKTLADYMSELSEEAHFAGWMKDVEFDLWRAVMEGPFQYGFLDLTSGHVERLLALSRACGGWIVWRGREEIVPFPEWQSIYLAHQAVQL